MSLTVLIPEIKSFGVTISNWEVMEKIKQASKPDDFVSLRVTNSSREMIHFEGELLSVKVMRKLTLLLTGKTIKLRGFAEPLRIQAKPFLSDFPTKKDWEEYFRNKGYSVLMKVCLESDQILSELGGCQSVGLQIATLVVIHQRKC